MGKHSAEPGEIERKKKKNRKNEGRDYRNGENEGSISKIGIFARLILLGSSIFLIYEVMNTNLIPFKYLAIGIAVIFLINLGFLIQLLKNRKNAIVKLVASVLVLVISAVFIFAGFKIKDANELLDNLDKDYKTLNFSVIVRDDSEYQELEDLESKTMGYYKNDAEGMEESIAEIENKDLDITMVAYTSLEELGQDLLDENIDSILLEDSYKSLLEDFDTELGDVEDDEEDESFSSSDDEENITDDETEAELEEEDESEDTEVDPNTDITNFEELTRVIYTFSIDLDLVEIVKDVSVTDDCFNIYISGIDTYGSIASVSRSDVNIVVTVNPTTKQILLTSIPRDYYVQLHGTTGYRDKLTHAGIYGIDMSVETIEDLLDIEINYYFKFNFTSVIEIVDAIGGVDVYSEYSFTSKDGYYYEEGYNSVNGKQALSFVRERKAFSDGDRQRGRNQQAMINAMVTKCITPSILSNYDSLLETVQDAFVTNMPSERIKSLVKMQLEDGSEWTITSNSLTGQDSKQYTYSYSGSALYVMIPYQDSIDYAKDLIDQVVNGAILEGSYQEDTSTVHTVVEINSTYVSSDDSSEANEITENNAYGNTTNTSNNIYDYYGYDDDIENTTVDNNNVTYDNTTTDPGNTDNTDNTNTDTNTNSSDSDDTSTDENEVTSGVSLQSVAE